MICDIYKESNHTPGKEKLLLLVADNQSERSGTQAQAVACSKYKLLVYEFYSDI
jgi:hypothetical protein